MGGKTNSASIKRYGIVARLNGLITKVCPIPPKLGIRILSFNRRFSLPRDKVVALIIVSLVLAFAFHPRLFIPDYPIRGTLENPYTVWTGHIKIESDIVIKGTNTLVIDGATIHNPSGYDVIVKDSGNLIVINSNQSSFMRDEFRVVSGHNSVVRVSNSTIGAMWVENKGGSVTIEGSHLNYLQSGRSRIVNSTIKELHVQVHVSGNFSIVGDVWTGNFDVMIEVDEDSVVKWPRYYLWVLNSANGLIDSPKEKLERIYVKNSRISLTNVNYTHYTSTHPYYFDWGANPTGVYLYAWNSQVSISNSNFGWFGGYSGPTLELHGSRAEVSRLVVTFIEVNDNSSLEGSRINAHYIEADGNSTAKITDSNERGWSPIKTGGKYPSIAENRWFGIFGHVKTWENARIDLENVTVHNAHYESVTLTGGESVGELPNEWTKRMRR